MAADWRVERDAAKRSFEAAVIALAIVEDGSSGGVLTLFLHANGRVADEWQESLEDAWRSCGLAGHQPRQESSRR